MYWMEVQISPCEGAILRGNVSCTVNGWLKEQDQQFFYKGIRALKKSRDKCILIAENYVEK